MSDTKTEARPQGKAPADIHTVKEARREIRAAMLDDDDVREQELRTRYDELRPPEAHAKAKAAKDDAEYLAWCERHDTAAREAAQANLYPNAGSIEQPIFWRDGQAIESGAARLDFYDSRHELRILLNTTRAFQQQGGYQVPNAFLLDAVQLFYSDGQLCEVRMSGYNMTPHRAENGEPLFDRWQTPSPPNVRSDGKRVKVTPDEQRRPQIAVLNETAQEAVTLESAYYARIGVGEAVPPPQPVLRLLVAWNTSGDLAAALEDAQSAEGYNLLTSQEVTMLERSACNGKRGKWWRTDAQSRTRIYEERGASHRIELQLTPEDEEVDLTVAALDKLTKAQDADFAFSMLYVCSVLAPPAPLPQNLAAIGWIDLDDVMEKIGWNPTKRSLTERDEMRRRIWDYVVYGDRAKVIGQRTIPYYDRNTGEVIETRLESSIWRIMDKERPLQAALFGEVPRRVRLVIGKEWEPLLTAPHLAQYFPLGELLGSIAPNQVAGDWARSIGLVLAGLWRRNPREVQAGIIRPTRRELLTTFTPKTQTVDYYLDSDKPKRAVGYWRDALGKLLELDIIARQGEPTRTVADMLRPYGREGWQKTWLDEQVTIVPGPKFQPHVQARIIELPPLKPQNLRKRGRPRKRPNAE